MQCIGFRSTLAILLLASAQLAASPQALQVRIVHREESTKELKAVVPALPEGDKSSDKGEKSAAEKTTTTAAKQAEKTNTVTVTGAILTLRLPDGRGVKVGCESKYALRFDYINRRSCRVPPVDEVTAEFEGDQAKLIWAVSLDGKKTQSETYTILNILPAGHR